MQTQKTVKANTTLSGLCEFVQTNEMVSRILAMVSEDGSVNTILAELLGGTGSSFELKPASTYAQPWEELTFLQLTKRVQDQGELLVGYQKMPASVTRNTVINPRDKHETKMWKHAKLIVLTGDPLYPDLHSNTSDELSYLNSAIKKVIGKGHDGARLRHLLSMLAESSDFGPSRFSPTPPPHPPPWHVAEEPNDGHAGGVTGSTSVEV